MFCNQKFILPILQNKNDNKNDLCRMIHTWIDRKWKKYYIISLKITYQEYLFNSTIFRNL